MADKYREYSQLNLPNVAEEVLKKWKEDNTFERSMTSRPEDKNYVFFEGPPSANGLPGIHHVMARAIKDIICRYKTLQGYRVNRKAGWDTHGLPVELGVEKELGITKEDIGKKITIEEYNAACRKAVMKYTDVWNDLTEKMGYWVDMDDPYITYENKYIESVWWLLGEIYNKGLMYKGYTIQPYSPKAGTGLSSHELNQPGCYRDVKDATAIAQFKTKPNELLPDGTFLIAWTTTPWTLPSNTALAVGPKIEYVLVETFNQYSFEKMNVVLAKNLLGKQLSGKYVEENDENQVADFSKENKKIPYRIVKEFVGTDLVGIEYEQLLPFALPAENPDKAFRVIGGDFVTVEDGTGIVHIAPTFGADDAQVAKDAGVPPMLVKDENDNLVPLVDLQGKFRAEISDGVFLYGGEYVKEDYLDEDEKSEEFLKQKEILEREGKIKELKEYLNVDKRIVLKLQEEGKLFKKETYEHSYPHCWRTDKPVLYYPLDSWFIKVTEVKEKMFALNQTINWKPESTGTGRFGNWLENANDWNLSRSRFWGIPIPIWRTEDGKEAKCISSVEQLKNECEKAVNAGFMETNPLADFIPGNMSEDNYNVFDLHKNYVDAITLVSESGQPMKREADLIDVWFDSGSMPVAQHHYPFENRELIDEKGFGQADFIAEGVDQTRGWFYTLHAIATMVFGRTAYKNVISNGLVLDKNGHKMSKRLGNAVDPFETLSKYGPDATRWYMITNAQPWDNLKFDEEGIVEVQRKFFGTLYNTYNGFLAVYANIDGFKYEEEEVPFADRPEIDRWVLSRLNSVVKEVQEAYETFEPTKAGRLIQNFVNDELSNWYVRLCRRRFWKGDYTTDKISAYQTLYNCLEKVAIMASPIAPFFMDRLFSDLNDVTGRYTCDSVHLANFPKVNEAQIDKDLEYRMNIAQRASSLVLSLRKREKIKVRQPLQKMMIPALDSKLVDAINDVKELVLSEVNVKELEIIDESNEMLTKKIKPNFKTIGKKYGKLMKPIISLTNGFDQGDIAEIERNQGWKGEVEGEEVTLDLNDFEILTQDIPGWLVANDNDLTVALDVTLSDELREEGIAREFVNRIQNLRKDSGLEVTDRILLTIKSDEKINEAIKNNLDYICSETLADNLTLANELSENKTLVEIDADINSEIELIKAD
ncbi:isoleucine--tRNA ligase [Parvicella tangerina]|uniref:Isoleucine--tRNA ligase n=1 Tax=Parvicella tangerina TaxID=2829795 RepID=A0A916NJ28_9FLAO|nr:isoleucine--tRNA ligase [Parvicella tangerina]CAG5086195.1 Isoleucine--tRNA ligase [Parvicella tangerina]